MTPSGSVTLQPSSAARFHAPGFTLVELMVALVVGLIVTLAAVGFVVSVARANSEDIQVTRLNQELRALSEVINREIRRARYVSDPIGNVTQAGVGVPQENDDVTVNAAQNCISLEYDQPPTEGAGTVARAIYLNGGFVYLSGTTACSGGQAISSPQLTITELSFDNDTDPTNGVPDITNHVWTRIGGKLSNGVGNLATLVRTFQQDTYIRSGEVE